MSFSVRLVISALACHLRHKKLDVKLDLILKLLAGEMSNLS